MNIKLWKESSTARIGVFIIVYLLMALLMYWIVADSWSMTAVKTDSVSMGYLLPAGSEVTQKASVAMDGLEVIEFVPHFDHQERTGHVTLVLLDGEEVLWTKDVAAADLATDQRCAVKIDPFLSVEGKTLTLKVVPNETGVALWAGNTVSTGRFDVSVQTDGLFVNGEAYEGCLVLSTQGHKLLQAHRWFWPVALVLLVAAVALICLTHVQYKHGKKTVLTLAVTVCTRYSYLLKQLVNRDFRVKYKTSTLGMVWSLLNPLLTMMVYLFVFSTLFQSNIANFPLYLMSGIIAFSFFSESTNLGMASIVGNSSLITKVYMPKLIYPLSKVLSSAINFCISLIPLCLVMLITGVTIQKSILLLPLVVAFLIVFSFGMSLILATMNVFFRDTQFLWSVLLMMLNFLTPVFYPESIIPTEFLAIYRCNPMYQIIYFMRTIIIDGISPAPATYLCCILSCGTTLLLGLWIFRKNQDRFVLYL